jgi:hypothetical protein
MSPLSPSTRFSPGCCATGGLVTLVSILIERAHPMVNFGGGERRLSTMTNANKNHVQII